MARSAINALFGDGMTPAALALEKAREVTQGWRLAALLVL